MNRALKLLKSTSKNGHMLHFKNSILNVHWKTSRSGSAGAVILSTMARLGLSGRCLVRRGIPSTTAPPAPRSDLCPRHRKQHRWNCRSSDTRETVPCPYVGFTTGDTKSPRDFSFSLSGPQRHCSSSESRGKAFHFLIDSFVVVSCNSPSVF